MKKVVLCILVLGQMVLIFYLSSQPAVESKALSDGVKAVVEKVVAPIEGISNIDIQAGLIPIRKYAHFFAYFVLGFLLVLALKAFEVKKYNRMAALTALMYAVSDEIHQSFVPGRSAELRDVVIDFLGVLTAHALVGLVSKLRRRS